MSDVDDELAERARARVGQTLCGKYRIERVLGVGGMAFVYVATHRNGRRVAIKMLHPELSIRADIRKRFLLEGHAANAVNHPGAVVVIDDDVAEDGAAFLVMELLDGQSVEDVWRAHGGTLPSTSVLAIGRELCDVLAAAHEVGIIHRDIKPANLFVTTDGRLKVLDFGLARVRDGTAGANATATGLVFGTPAFLPPEQAAGRVNHIDARTDVWAVGATMFTLLTGRTVHEGESAQNLVVLAATKPPRSVASLSPATEPEIVEIIDRALAFDKEDRWPSARDMHAAIAVLAADASLPDVATNAAKVADSASTLPTTPVRPIGTRTSAPVASAAPTTPQVVRPRAGRVAALAQRVVASIPMTSVAWRKRASIAATLGVVIAALVITVFVRLTFRDRPPAMSVSADSTIAPVTAAPSDVPPTTLEVALSSSAPDPGPTSDLVAPAKPAPSTKAATHRWARPTPVTQRPKDKGPDCTHDFTLDANGKKIWKPECVH